MLVQIVVHVLQMLAHLVVHVLQMLVQLGVHVLNSGPVAVFANLKPLAGISSSIPSSHGPIEDEAH